MWQSFAKIGPGTSKNRWTEKINTTKIEQSSLSLSRSRATVINSCVGLDFMRFTPPTVGNSKHISRQDSVGLLNRLRICYCRIMHSYLLAADDLLTCEPCVIPLRVRHILAESTNFRNVREKYSTVRSLKSCLQIASTLLRKSFFTANCNVCYFQGRTQRGIKEFIPLQKLPCIVLQRVRTANTSS